MGLVYSEGKAYLVGFMGLVVGGDNSFCVFYDIESKVSF